MQGLAGPCFTPASLVMLPYPSVCATREASPAGLSGGRVCLARREKAVLPRSGIPSPAAHKATSPGVGKKAASRCGSRAESGKL